MSELRQNLLTGDWVVIAAERAKRPESFSREPKPPVDAHRANCPFCAGNENLTPPEIYALRPNRGRANRNDWLTRVVPNKFPAFSDNAKGDGSNSCFYMSMPAVGDHEVIIHGPDHNKTLADMDAPTVARVLSVYQKRLSSLARNKQVASAIIIVNQGREAGASIEHPHSQVFAMPIVAPLIDKELTRIKEYSAQKGKCLVCAVIEHELDVGERLVAENEHFLAFCPYAPRTPFEVYIIPKTHQSDFTIADRLGKAAQLLQDVLRRLSQRLGSPPYNMYLHSRPFAVDGDYHWHFAILPKITTMAGFEFGADVMINVIEPETAAAFLREEGREKEEGERKRKGPGAGL